MIINMKQNKRGTWVRDESKKIAFMRKIKDIVAKVQATATMFF